jgi:hypothetical protein
MWAGNNTSGRSRGGPTTKIHRIIDALGLRQFFELTAGQKHDSHRGANRATCYQPGATPQLRQAKLG